MDGQDDFLLHILEKIINRYERKGKLSGTMKLGQRISYRELAMLHNFFGLSPIRINTKEEVRLYFDSLLTSGSEKQWLNKIEDLLGCKISPKGKPKYSEQLKVIIKRLGLAFPDLKKAVHLLAEESATIERMLTTKGEVYVTNHLFKVAETVRFVLDNKTPITVSELGARFFLDSKALRHGELRALVLQWLRLFSLDAELLETDEDVWACYNLLNDRLTVNAVVYGPIIYEKNGMVFDWIYRLYEQGEAATIGWSNIHDIDTMYFRPTERQPPDIICSENEAPFSQLMRQQPDKCLLFTSGFPGSAVQKIYSLLAPQAARCYHWGDSDPAGLRIAAIMNEIHPVTLYRCDLPTLEKLRSSLIPLSQKQKDICLRLLAATPKLSFAKELRFTMENGWLEQESWR